MNNTVIIQSTDIHEGEYIGDMPILLPADRYRPRIITGFRKTWMLYTIRFALLSMLIKAYPNPYNWILGLHYLIRLRKKVLGDYKLKKMVFINGKYYMGLYTPGFLDDTYKKFIFSELDHFKPTNKDKLRFNHVHLAITNKCALQCDHCYAWDHLNKKDKLSETDLTKIIDKLQVLGTGQIHLTGGEPLLKYELVLKLVDKAKGNSNIWINTSGYQLTDDYAKKLKEAGLTGLFISLDHFDEHIHNQFRKYRDAYYWAIAGAKNAVSNQLAVAFSICITKDFISEENLMSYMLLAKQVGVHFVQFLEPKAVGHYKNEKVSLSKSDIELLEEFYVKMNFSDNYLDFPIINYHGYYQRRQGCFASGNRSIYLDADGNINACNFCHTKSGSILDTNFEKQLNSLSAMGCQSY